MLTSTEIDFYSKRFGEEKAVETIAKAGFDAWDFSMFSMAHCNRDNMTLYYNEDHPLGRPDYLAFARKLKKIGLDNGIFCNQSHAPFPSCEKRNLDILKRAIECTAEAGGKICVIHPNNNDSAEENAEMYNELLPFAKSCDVRIATENMWNWNHDRNEASDAACSNPQSFVVHLDAVNDPYLVACLDIGHAEMKGLGTTAPEMILALGDRLQALHIHDNDKWHDSHMPPFTMKIDFVPIIAALKKINYSGIFTLEASSCIDNVSDIDVPEAVAALYSSVKRLADMFDAD